MRLQHRGRKVKDSKCEGKMAGVTQVEEDKDCKQTDVNGREVYGYQRIKRSTEEADKNTR